MNEHEYTNKLLMLREFIQRDAEDLREAVNQREKLMTDRIDKWLKQVENETDERLIETFKDQMNKREGF